TARHGRTRKLKVSRLLAARYVEHGAIVLSSPQVRVAIPAHIAAKGLTKASGAIQDEVQTPAITCGDPRTRSSMDGEEPTQGDMH
ncbi:unnamed protein product, partial [Effrenium voratum]